MTEDAIPYVYARIRACLRGPMNDPRTIAVLLAPVGGGEPHLAAAPLPDDEQGAAVRQARDEIYAQAMEFAVGRKANSAELLVWWRGRAAQEADFVYLAAPKAGCAPDLRAEAEVILAAAIAT